MNSFVSLVDTCLNIYMWIHILAVIASWLQLFRIIDTSNLIVQRILYALTRLTEPVLSRIRSFLPSLGGIDISPMIVILLIYFLRSLLREYFLF